ncbi:MAG: hypothetical protein ABIN58_08985, partial [candidate division WOR-3 bacterium]
VKQVAPEVKADESKPGASSRPPPLQEKALPPTAQTKDSSSTTTQDKAAPPAPVVAVPEKPSAPGGPAPAAQPEKAELKAAPLAVPAGQAIFPLVHIDSGERVILVEKNTRTLHVLRSIQGKLSPVKTYPCLVGKNIKDKEKTGDMATPEGIYYLVEFIPASKLSEIYGMGAFVLN